MLRIFYSTLGCISLLIAIANVFYIVLDVIIMFIKNDYVFNYLNKEGKRVNTNLLIDILDNFVRAFMATDFGFFLLGIEGTLLEAIINHFKMLF